MIEAKRLSLDELKEYPKETTLFIETKQTLRPAFYMGVIDRAALGNAEDRYAIHLITPAKIAKYWEWRLNNKTWRVWSAKPTREQRMEEKWNA